MPGTSVTLITAGRGEGKTTFLQQYAARALANGRSVGGIASLAVLANERRIGYDLIDLRSGKHCALARVVAQRETSATVGMYRFENAALAEGNAAVISAVRGGSDLIAIDEVGPLELRGGGWAPGLRVALAECSQTQELVVVVRRSLVAELPRHFPSERWASARRLTPPARHTQEEPPAPPAT